MYAMADTSFASWLEEQLREQGISQAELAQTDVDTAHRRASPVDNWRL